MNQTVTLHYHRPPDRTDVFVQQLVYADADVLVTYNAATRIAQPMRINGQHVLDPGSPVVWFTFPGARFDVGRFHTDSGEFTGYYADILEPVTVQNRAEFSVTDLFVDVWVGAGREPVILDVDELQRAVAQHWLAPDTAELALREAERLVSLFREGAWPPAIVNEWPLERVIASLA